ncbi:hypothetical protein TIFTF001_015959 [Ficus carica]|uniref:DUF3700 domain-containing protein n=1 Tax=Ficus carica TaxID=3494 RepID=A0AA88D9G2_FICCA|nr:hypothetical protein TIFTF001_015959 [Ficus carica]
MLAVFDKSVAQSPDALQSPHSSDPPVSALKDGLLARLFSSAHPSSVTINLGSSENVATLKQQYGLNKTANEAIIVIEAYRTLRDRGPFSPDQVVRDIQGKFTYILFDSAAKATFFAADADASVPFFWGTDSEGNVVLSDNAEIVKAGCGKSFAPFPKGCFFTTTGGLRSFEHPLHHLKPVPRVDSKGEMCGANFKVDEASRKETSGMPRVGSAANWSSNF